MLPLLLAGAQLAFGVGSAIFGHSAQKKAAEASNAADQRIKDATATSANSSAAFQNQTLDLQLAQMRQAAGLQTARNTQAGAQSILATDRAARMQDATARLSAGAAGLEGVSVDAISNDIASQDAQARFQTNRSVTDANKTINTNLVWSTQQNILQRQGIESERQSRINMANAGSSAASPSWAYSGLQIGGSVLDFFNSINKKP